MRLHFSIVFTYDIFDYGLERLEQPKRLEKLRRSFCFVLPFFYTYVKGMITMGVIGVNIEESCSAMFEHGHMLIVK